MKREECDVESESQGARSDKGLKAYWSKHASSIDGLPGLKTATESSVIFKNTGIPGKNTVSDKPHPLAQIIDKKVVVGFSAGVLVSAVFITLFASS